VLASARRLARMVGHDIEGKPMEIWKDLALTCKVLQIAQIKAAVLKHLNPHKPIIGAGVGSFLVKAIADDLGHTYLPVASVLEQHFKNSEALEVCFPAYAVASLFLSLNKHQYQLKHSQQCHA
jgi:(4-(4-[2-(gamma-L-glutamylamino)ethyl]phenoxymethyl)furan-2-yl)methanamine synthase